MCKCRHINKTSPSVRQPSDCETVRIYSICRRKRLWFSISAISVLSDVRRFRRWWTFIVSSIFIRHCLRTIKKSRLSEKTHSIYKMRWPCSLSYHEQTKMLCLKYHKSTYECTADVIIHIACVSWYSHTVSRCNTSCTQIKLDQFIWIIAVTNKERGKYGILFTKITYIKCFYWVWNEECKVLNCLISTCRSAGPTGKPHARLGHMNDDMWDFTKSHTRIIWMKFRCIRIVYRRAWLEEWRRKATGRNRTERIKYGLV